MQDNFQSERNQLSLILVEIAGEEFAVDLLEVKEIIRAGQIRRLPKSFDFVDGIYNYRGDIIHVINLNKKLNIKRQKLRGSEKKTEEENDSSKNFIMIVHIDDLTIGFFVDRIMNVAHISNEDIVGLSPIIQTNVNAKSINGIVKFKDRPRVWLNLKNILSDSEKSQIQKDLLF
ncbi:MAG: purine-binding chemotaxis protein CheW [Candidatus Lokiarchaeota archaeon]|nr:purine-binding chemotaxis protein CheW [Candidatus Lokiarchaeota archaeon]